MCLTEIKGILEAVGIGEVTNYIVDADVKSSRKITSTKDIKLIGGGGTDMRVGIRQAAEDARGDLDVAIVLTDGYTPWPTEDEQPRLKIIAVLTDGSTLTNLPPHIKGVAIDA